MSQIGLDIDNRLTRSIEEAQRRLEAATRERLRTEGVLEKHLREREEKFKELARHFLPNLDAGSATGRLREITECLRRLKRRRDQRADALDRRLRDHDARAAILNERFAEARQRGNEVRSQLEEASRRAEAQMAEDPDYLEALADLEQARNRRAQDEERAEEAKNLFSEQIEAYESEPVFRFLLERRFDTPDYAGRGWFARLDAMAARTIRWSEAKPHYDRLKALPQHLDAELERLEKEEEAIQGRINAVRDRHAQRCGVYGLECELEKRQRQKVDILKEIERERELHAASTAELKQLQEGDDPHTAEALDRVSSFLQSQSMAQLRERAAATPGQEDDFLVETLEPLAKWIEQAREGARQRALDEAEMSDRVERLAQLQTWFRRRGWDSSTFGVASGVNLYGIVEDILEGQMTVEEAQDAIRGMMGDPANPSS